MWVRMLAVPGNAAITSIDVVPVAVDVQVRRVTEHVDVTSTRGLKLEAVRGAIQRAWSQDVSGHGDPGPEGVAGTPAALDPALWFWGKCAAPTARARAPVGPSATRAPAVTWR